jgi:hypothetical protein
LHLTVIVGLDVMRVIAGGADGQGDHCTVP